MEKFTRLSTMVRLLVAFALLNVGYDLSIMLHGQSDPNEHVPFLLPVLIGILALVFFLFERHWQGMTPESKNAVIESLKADSGLKPENYDPDRYPAF